MILRPRSRPVRTSRCHSTSAWSASSFARSLTFDSLEDRRLLAAGTLDLSFGDDGQVITPLGAFDQANRVAVQADRKIVTVGNVGADLNAPSMWAVTRYNPDGSLDTSFGGDGIVLWDNPTAKPYDVAIQADGKIVAVGVALGEIVGGANANGEIVCQENNCDFAAMRLLADGSFDTTFGADGVVLTDLSEHTDMARAVAIQPDGKIVVAGTADHTSTTTDLFTVVRYKIDGSLDASFGVGGIVETRFGGPSQILDMTLQRDGKIVVAGQIGNPGWEFAAARYETNGNLDRTFSGDGIVVTNFPGYSGGSTALAVAVQFDGKIVLGGRARNSPSIEEENDFALARLLPNGSLDGSFGSNGKVTTDFAGTGSQDFDQINDIAIQSNGKIVAAGRGAGFDFGVARYLDNGSLDTDFGADGLVTTDFGTNADEALGMVLQANGDIVVAGIAWSNNTTADSVLARYEGDHRLQAAGDLDETFGNGTSGVGTVVTTFPALASGDPVTILSQHVQSDAKSLVLATVNGRRVMVRHNSDGTIDDQFGSGPHHLLDLGSAAQVGEAVVEGDFIYVLSTSPATGNLAVSRYTSSGALDETFGLNGTAETKLSPDPDAIGTYFSFWGGSSVADQFAFFRKPTAHLAITAEGVVVAANVRTVPLYQDAIRITRLRASDQQTDPAFGDDGVVTVAASVDDIHSPVLRELSVRNGRLVTLASHFVGGYIAVSSIGEFDASGALIQQFTQDGQRFIQLEDAVYPPTAAPVSHDWLTYFEPVFLERQGEQIVVAGARGFDGNGIALRRYNVDGSVDYTFGQDGSIFLPHVIDEGVTSSLSGVVTSLAVQPDGKILVVVGGQRIIRFDADGIFDTSFANDGVTSSNQFASRAAVDANGNILIVSGVGPLVEVSRLLGEPSFDPPVRAAHVGRFDAVYLGETAAITVRAIDPDPAQAAAGFEYVIDWGDGSPTTTVPRSAHNGGGLSVEHVYSALGDFTIQVTATNSANDAVSASMDVTVAQAIVRLGDLLVGGTPGNDDITLGEVDGLVAVNVNGTDFGPFASSFGASVFLLGGADTITADSQVHVFYGTDGADTVTANVSGVGEVRVFGLGGDDAITVNASEMGGGTAHGGSGNDTLHVNATDNGWAEGQGEAGDDQLNANVSGFGWAGLHGGWYNELYNSGHDTLVVNAVDASTAEAYGGNGDDTISITGSEDSTTFAFGGNHFDQITIHSAGSGGAFIDHSIGDEYHDVAIDGFVVNLGALAGPVSVGNPFRDHAAGSYSYELTVVATPEADVIVKTPGLVTLGDPVTETVSYYGAAAVVIEGGDGDDTITDPGEDTEIRGGRGDDTIIIDATTGSGVFVDGEEGSDTYVIVGGSLAGPVTISDSGASGTDVVTIIGTPGDDAFEITEEGVLLNGVLIAFAGDVSLVTLDGGGGGNDDYELEGAPSAPFDFDDGDPADRLTVTSTSDAVDYSDGFITLREALLYAKAHAGPDTIDFAILPEDGGYQGATESFLIAPEMPLPVIDHVVTIDGYTQDGAAANTNGAGQGLNAVLKIELRGPHAGLVIESDGSTVRGLAINSTSGNGIAIRGGSDNRIQGNYLGTDVTGAALQGNTLATFKTGVHVLGVPGKVARGNVIGVDDRDGNDAAERNLISNWGFGIVLEGGNSQPASDAGYLVQETVIAGNLIGTNADGDSPIPNVASVGLLFATLNDRIGTDGDGVADALERNVLSGNLNAGVIVGTQSTVTAAAKGTKIAGNYIGVGVNGALALGNGRTPTTNPPSDFGVLINSATEVMVGGALPVLANIIASNVGPGVAVSTTGPTALRNTIRGNSIHSNSALGIDLIGAATNAGQAPPTVDLAVRNATTLIAGTAQGAPNTVVTLDFYANALGQDEGQLHLPALTSATVTTNASGVASFSIEVTSPPGDLPSITATVTSALGDTSEFSQPKDVHLPPTASFTGPGIGVTGQVLTFTVGAAASTGGAASGPFAYAIDWDGDGQTDQTQSGNEEVTITHVYAAASTSSGYAARVRATDELGGISDWTPLAAPVVVSEPTGESLQNVLDDLPEPPPGEPITLSLQVATEQAADTLVAAVNNLEPSAQPIEIVVDLGGNDFTGVTVAAPDNVVLTFVNGTFNGASPALIVSSGVVVVLDSLLQNTTDAPTILVTGGSLTIRRSTIAESTTGNRAAVEVTGGTVDLGTAAEAGENVVIVNGPGELIRNTGAAPVSALGNTFQNGDAALASPYRIEDRIFHALDAGGGGLVSYVANQVFVTASSGSIQRAVNAVPSNATVWVETKSLPDYAVGEKLITVQFENGPAWSLATDDLNPSQRKLTVTGTAGADVLTFSPSGGAIRASLVGYPTGSFSPNGRIVAHGGAGDDDLQVAGSIVLPAWLYGGEGDDRLKGGAGHDVLLGETGDDLLGGGDGRDLLWGGAGADRIVGNNDEDILVAGTTDFDATAGAIFAIQREWTSARTFEQRVANINGTGTGPSYDRLNGNYFLKSSGAGATVHDDNAIDLLTGSAAQDWFFANLLLDNDDDAVYKDKITDLHASEFADDLDFLFGS